MGLMSTQPESRPHLAGARPAVTTYNDANPLPNKSAPRRRPRGTSLLLLPPHHRRLLPVEGIELVQPGGPSDNVAIWNLVL